MGEDVFSNGYVSFSNSTRSAADVIDHTFYGRTGCRDRKQPQTRASLMGLKNTMDGDDAIRGVVWDDEQTSNDLD